MKFPVYPVVILATAGSLSMAGAAQVALPQDTGAATTAINQLGLDLLSRGTTAGANALLSPYSIQGALAMAHAGAAGETLLEMRRVLHYPADEASLHRSFAGLKDQLNRMADASARRGERAKERGETGTPVTLSIANRLFGQAGYQFRAPFLELTDSTYGAPFRPLDFQSDWESARREINDWVAGQTRQRIRDLVPSGGVNSDTRLVLVNAIFLQAPWAVAFPESATRSEPFHVNGGERVPVPTMNHTGRFGYRRGEDHTIVTVPYSGGELQLLIVLPESPDGLPVLEAKLDAGTLENFSKVAPNEVRLHLPKFKLEPPPMRLGGALQSLGLRSVFDQPQGSANFDRMAPRKPDDYLFVSEVFHQTFLELDERGTEAAAATAVVMMRPTAIQLRPDEPLEVKVDRPFLFAIQHRPSGACLFLGRVMDPR